MKDSKTQLHVYTDDDGNLHYDVTIDGRDMERMKEHEGREWTKELQYQWDRIKDWPDDYFFKKAFCLSLLVNYLYNVDQRSQKDA